MHTTEYKVVRIIFTLIASLFLGQAWAAGAMDTAKVGISLRIERQVNVVTASNMQIQRDIASDRFRGSQTLCVRRADLGNYSVSAHSQNSNTTGSSTFTLKQGSQQLGYRVSWNGEALPADTRLLPAHVEQCSNAGNVTLDVETLPSQQHATNDNAPMDVLTLMVAAE
jgi:hypothetical protein